MAMTHPRRGRPPGTGIDDSIWLRELNRLIEINPATRPTTAIKALGVTNPSTIRRLRDKHNELKRQVRATRISRKPTETFAENHVS